jgi:hypothetical protein
MAAFGATATRLVTASCPFCSNGDGWLDDHYEGAKLPLSANSYIAISPAVDELFGLDGNETGSDKMPGLRDGRQNVPETWVTLFDFVREVSMPWRETSVFDLSPGFWRAKG